MAKKKKKKKAKKKKVGLKPRVILGARLTNNELKIIKSVEEKAARDAEMFVGFVKRSGSPTVTNLPKWMKDTFAALLREANTPDAEYSSRLSDLALKLALDVAGKREINPSQWTAEIHDDGRVFMRMQHPLLPTLTEPIPIEEPRIQEVLRAVFSRPRNLSLLRLAAGEVVRVRKTTVRSREFLLERGVRETEITATKNRWRKTKTKAAALPKPVVKGRRGQPDEFNPKELDEAWKHFRPTDSR